MLLRDVEVHVFKLDNDTFEAIGQVNEFTSLIWPDKFNGYATFELNAPVNEENNALIKEGNIVWCGGDNAAIIELIWSDMNEDGQKVYKAKGRTLEMFLTTRIIWGTYICTNKPSSTAMYEIVNAQCVNPSIQSRKIPFLECAPDDVFGKNVSLQKTGGEVYDAIQNIATDAELGFSVLFKPTERKLVFKVFQGADRTASSSSMVVFSTDLDDILSSSYYMNNQDVKNVAYIAGEDSGSDRVQTFTGDLASSGFLRREIYVDARDLQSEVINEDGTMTTISTEDYNEMLVVRGNEKLSECIIFESFEAKMRVIGDIRYTYGVDYFKGDKVIVRDTDLGVQVFATVSEVTKSFDDRYSLDITFGFSYPTLFQKIKRQVL